MKDCRILYLLVLACAALFVSCSKGDAGAAGPAGPAGPNGANGADGVNGSDSVLYSAWIPMNMADTIDANADTIYYQNFIATSLTSAILNSGSVLTYLETIDGNGDSLFFNASTVLTESYYVGDIFVESLPPAASNSAGPNWAGYNFRYVVIPGSIAATLFKGMTQQQIKTIDYPTFNRLVKATVNKTAAPQAKP
jgi:hypothetical protein